MPFGLYNLPSTYQRLMYGVLSGLIGEKCYVYSHDICVFSGPNINDHIAAISIVFDRLRKFNLKLKPSKCKFARKETNYLGHKISSDHVKSDPDKVAAINKYLVPKTVRDIRGFLGFVVFYREFIQNFSKHAKPLEKINLSFGIPTHTLLLKI